MSDLLEVDILPPQRRVGGKKVRLDELVLVRGVAFECE